MKSSSNWMPISQRLLPSVGSVADRDEAAVALDVDVLDAGAGQFLGLAFAADRAAAVPGEREVRARGCRRRPATGSRPSSCAVFTRPVTRVCCDRLVADAAALGEQRAVLGVRPQASAPTAVLRLARAVVAGACRRISGMTTAATASARTLRFTGVHTRCWSQPCTVAAAREIEPPTRRLTWPFMQFQWRRISYGRMCESNGMLWALLRQYVRPYRWLLAVVAVLQLISTLASLYLPTVNAAIIDDGVAKGDTDTIVELGGVMLAVTALQVVCAVGAAPANGRKPRPEPRETVPWERQCPTGGALVRGVACPRTTRGSQGTPPNANACQRPFWSSRACFLVPSPCRIRLPWVDESHRACTKDFRACRPPRRVGIRHAHETVFGKANRRARRMAAIAGLGFRDRVPSNLEIARRCVSVCGNIFRAEPPPSSDFEVPAPCE